MSKLSIEHYLRLLSDLRPMRTVSLRISNPYGEGQRAARGQGIIAAAMQHTVAGTPMTIWGDGTAERDFLHVVDVAQAFVAAAGYRGAENVFNIGSGTSLSLRDTLDAAQTATGSRSALHGANWAGRGATPHGGLVVDLAQLIAGTGSPGWRLRP